MDFDIAFVDLDGEGCLPGLGILVGVAVVIGISQVLMQHWIFAIGLVCLGMAGVFGIVANKKGRHQKPNGLQELGVVVCIIGFMAFSAYGVYDYQHQQHMIEVQEQIEADAEAEVKRIEAAKQQKIKEENAKIGAFGRFKRWAFGVAPTTSESK